MAINEAKVKRDAIEAIKLEGGWGRRIEDQYAVGVLDTILIPKGGPVFFAEFKIMRAKKWGMTPRQLHEAQQIGKAESASAIPCLIGFGPATKRLYIVDPMIEVTPEIMAQAMFIEPGGEISTLLRYYLRERRT